MSRLLVKKSSNNNSIFSLEKGNSKNWLTTKCCVPKKIPREPQIRFHRNMESVYVLYVIFTIMFNFIFVFLLAFYVYGKLNSFISVHNTVQSDCTTGPQRHDHKHAIENMLEQVHRVIKKMMITSLQQTRSWNNLETSKIYDLKISWIVMMTMTPRTWYTHHHPTI